MRGQVAGRTWIQRRVTEQQAVPQHAVEYVDQQVEVGIRAQIPADLASLEQFPQRGPALGRRTSDSIDAATNKSPVAATTTDVIPIFCPGMSANNDIASALVKAVRAATARMRWS